MSDGTGDKIRGSLEEAKGELKQGVGDLTDDDRATLYGAFLNVAEKLQGQDREQALALWKRKGKRAFENTAP